MPIFAAGDLPYQQTIVGTIGTAIWSNSPGGTALTSPRDITLVNAGTVGCYVTGGSIVSLNGVWVAPGGQLTVQGTAQSALWAMTAAGTTTTIASLATTVDVV